MAAVFNCPHCEKSYPNNPALIGRKVRCSECKGVFQLQGDGVAIKVEVAEKKSAQPGTNMAAKTQLTQQLKGRSKRINKKALTERIQNSRSALRDAAEAALSGVQEEKEEKYREEKKVKSSKLEAAKSVEIYRSRQTNGGPFKTLCLALAFLVFAVCVIFFLLSEPSPQKTALDDFSKRVGKQLSEYPQRMNEYRKRMWIFTRDGINQPTIILNANMASLGDPVELPWDNYRSICQEHFGGMSLMPFLAIMVSSDKQAMVDQLWQSFDFKYDYFSFLRLLNRRGVKFILCSEVPKILKQAGVSDRDVYILSVLLAGTEDGTGSPCFDFGLLGNIAIERVDVSEFNGVGGMELIERANEYDVAGAVTFSGLVLGCSGVAGRADEWRVFDLRRGGGMSEFYDVKHNPFTTLSERTAEYLKKTYENPNMRSPELESEGQE